MIARSLSALTLACVLLLPALGRAEYDWYTQKEGSRSPPEEESDDGYTDPGGARESSRASREGFALGLRFAFAHPLGESSEDEDLDQVTKGVLKGQIDLDYGINPNFLLGVYFAAGGGLLSAQMKRICNMTVAGITIDADCKLLSMEAGLAAAYRFLPESLINPWLGANFGLEWLRLTLEEQGIEGRIAYLGFAFGASVGADVQLGNFAFGPYFSPQFAQFMRADVKFDNPLGGFEDDGGKIDNRAFHYWLNFGLRARYQF